MKSNVEKLYDNKLLTLVIAASISIGAGMGVGIVISIVGNFFYLVLLFPLAMGFAGGSFLAKLAKKLRIRKGFEITLLSMLMTLTIYGAYHYGRYVALQMQTSIILYSDFSKAMEDESLNVARTFIDYAMREETGYPGFGGYMLYKAKEGVSIGRFYSSSRLNLDFTLTWLYWFMEMGTSLWVIVRMARKSVDGLYCEFCKNWYGTEKHLGGTSLGKESQLLALISHKDFPGLKTLLENEAEIPSVELYLQRCETCDPNISYLNARRAYSSPRGTVYFKDVAQHILNPIDSRLLSGEAGLSGD
jgi:hypothetical protein